MPTKKNNWVLLRERYNDVINNSKKNTTRFLKQKNDKNANERCLNLLLKDIQDEAPYIAEITRENKINLVKEIDQSSKIDVDIHNKISRFFPEGHIKNTVEQYVKLLEIDDVDYSDKYTAIGNTIEYIAPQPEKQYDPIPLHQQNEEVILPTKMPTEQRARSISIQTNDIETHNFVTQETQTDDVLYQNNIEEITNLNNECNELKASLKNLEAECNFLEKKLINSQELQKINNENKVDINEAILIIAINLQSLLSNSTFVIEEPDKAIKLLLDTVEHIDDSMLTQNSKAREEINNLFQSTINELKKRAPQLAPKKEAINTVSVQRPHKKYSPEQYALAELNELLTPIEPTMHKECTDYFLPILLKKHELLGEIDCSNEMKDEINGIMTNLSKLVVLEYKMINEQPATNNIVTKINNNIASDKENNAIIELAKASLEIERLKEEIKSENKTNKILSNEISDQTKENLTLNEEIIELENINNQRHEQIVELQENLIAVNQEIEKLKNQLEEMKSKQEIEINRLNDEMIEKTTIEINELTTKIINLQNKILILQDLNEELKIDLDNKNALIATYENKFDNLQEEIKNLHTQISHLNSNNLNYNKLKEEISSLEEKIFLLNQNKNNISLEEDYNELKAFSKKQIAHILELQSSIESLRHSLQKEKLNEIESLRTQYNKQVDELKIDNAARIIQSAFLRNKNNLLKDTQSNLENSIHGLKEQLLIKEGIINKYRQEINELKKNAELGTDLKIQNLEKNLQNELKKNEVLRVELELLLERNLQNKENLVTIYNLHEEIKELNEKLENNKTIIDHSVQTIKQLQEVINQSKEKRVELEQELKNVKTLSSEERKNLEKKINNLDRAIENLQNKLKNNESLQEELIKKNSEINNLQEAIKELEQKLENDEALSSEEIKILNNEKEYFMELIANLQNENVSLIEEYNKLEQETGELEQELEFSRMINNDLKKDMDLLKEQLLNKENLVKKHQEEINELKKRLENANLSEERNDLENEINNLNRVIVNLQNENKKIIGMLEQENNDLQKEVIKLEEALMNGNKLFEEQESIINELKKENGLAVEYNNHIEEEYRILQRNLAFAKNEFAQYKQDAEDRIFELEFQLENLNNHNIYLTNHINELNGLLNIQQKENENAKNHIDALVKENTELKNKIIEQDEKLSKNKSDKDIKDLETQVKDLQEALIKSQSKTPDPINVDGESLSKVTSKNGQDSDSLSKVTSKNNEEEEDKKKKEQKPGNTYNYNLGWADLFALFTCFIFSGAAKAVTLGKSHLPLNPVKFMKETELNPADRPFFPPAGSKLPLFRTTGSSSLSH